MSGELELNVSPGALSEFNVQASTDLRTWTTITKLPRAAAADPIIDSSAKIYTNRFYRVYSPAN